MNNMNIAPPSSSNSLPEESLKATQFLAMPTKLPFEIPDKINETLSQIPPPQLIELIANLKNMLNSTDPMRAAEVFRLSPNLAAAATQALLLMGFIDEEVIQEAMKAEVANTSAPPIPQAQPYPNSFNPSNQGYNNTTPPMGAYPPNYGHQPRKFPNQSTNFGQNPNFNQKQGYPNNQNHNYGGNSNPPPPQRFGSGYPPNQNLHQNLPRVSPVPMAPPTTSRWPHLPHLAQMKLANVPVEQAELIAQVLSLTPEQIIELPPDRQNMVAGIKQQYS